MIKRAFDVLFSLTVLVAASPIMMVAAIGILSSSRGPVFYQAQRVGKDGVHFTMLKFRTMHVSGGGAVITSSTDQRVFPFGRFLRATKLDELPQFLNVFLGQMSVVGPRPEDPKIVEQHYTPWMAETLRVAPGVTSPGSIFYYAHGERLVEDSDPEGSYVRQLLPPKLAIERAYLDRGNLLSDLHCILLTAASILGKVAGFKVEPPPVDLMHARNWVPADTLDVAMSN